MSHLSDFLIARVNASGWLSIASLYYDNSYITEVYKTSGEICLSPSAGLIFTTNPYDTTGTAAIGNSLVHMDGDVNHTEMMNNLTVTQFDNLEHVQMNFFTWKSNMYLNTDKKLVMPDYPLSSELNALTLNADTGLYNATDTVSLGSNMQRKVSTLPLYDTKKGYQYVGADVVEWKAFYAKQSMFRSMVATLLGVSDVI